MDRNNTALASSRACTVALRKESVDRNKNRPSAGGSAVESLSARRAWIEIFRTLVLGGLGGVALRKESVDRNYIIKITGTAPRRRSPQGERG